MGEKKLKKEIKALKKEIDLKNKIIAKNELLIGKLKFNETYYYFKCSRIEDKVDWLENRSLINRILNK